MYIYDVDLSWKTLIIFNKDQLLSINNCQVSTRRCFIMHLSFLIFFFFFYIFYHLLFFIQIKSNDILVYIIISAWIHDLYVTRPMNDTGRDINIFLNIYMHPDGEFFCYSNFFENAYEHTYILYIYICIYILVYRGLALANYVSPRHILRLPYTLSRCCSVRLRARLTFKGAHGVHCKELGRAKRDERFTDICICICGNVNYDGENKTWRQTLVYRETRCAWWRWRWWWWWWWLWRRRRHHKKEENFKCVRASRGWTRTNANWARPRPLREPPANN